METLETAKGRFPWTDSGILCLQMITASIAKGGGRMKTGYRITNHEAPDWFNKSELFYFRKRYNRKVWEKMKRAENNFQSFWNDERIKKVRMMWPNFDSQIIADQLGKTRDDVRYIAKKHMSPEEYKDSFYNRNKNT